VPDAEAVSALIARAVQGTAHPREETAAPIVVARPPVAAPQNAVPPRLAAAGSR
jgi:hypothetical protein